RRALGRSGEETLAVGRRHAAGTAVRAVIACAPAFDRHVVALLQRFAAPALAHEAVRARELEAPVRGFVRAERSALPGLLFGFRIVAALRASAPGALADLARVDMDPCVRVLPFELRDVAGDLDGAIRIELR